MSMSTGTTSGCTPICDMDMDITECLQNCPELDVPLLDASVLDQLCLSDDLWANLDAADAKDGTCAVGGDPENAIGQTLQTFIPEDILGFATPPDSPPDLYSNPVSSASGGSCSQPQQPIVHNAQTEAAKYWLQQCSHTHTCSSSPSPGVASEATQTPTQSLVQGRNAIRENQAECEVCNTGVQQNHSKDGSMTVLPSAMDSVVQVLKSGEVVCLSLPQQPQEGIENHSKGVTTSLKKEALCVGQKRPHPDSSLPESKLTRKQQRMIKNREAASLSRQKKKEYVQTMEARLKEAAVKNTALMKENNLLRNQIVTLEKENHLLRSSLSRPSTPLGSLTTKPAVVMMVALIFTFSFFSFPRHMIPSPFAVHNLPSTALSVPVHSQHGRALLSYTPMEELVADTEKALVPISNTIIPPLETVGSPKQGSLAHTHGPSSSVVSTVCSCPVEGSSGLNASANATVMKRMNSEVSQCFKWHERHFLQWQRELQQTKTSLAIVNTDFSIDGSFPYQINDVARLYPYIKKSFTRDLYSYYLISFKDHILLDAPSHNSSEPPLLSLIIPSDAPSPPGYLPMLQIDCEVLDTTLFHVELPQS